MLADKNPTNRNFFLLENFTCQCEHCSQCFISKGCLSRGFGLSHLFLWMIFCFNINNINGSIKRLEDLKNLIKIIHFFIYKERSQLKNIYYEMH